MNFTSHAFRLSISAFVFLLAASLAHAQVTYRWVGADGRVHYSDETPPDNAVRKEQRDLRDWNSIPGAEKGFEQQRAERLYPITLYTISECAGECRMARDYLNRYRIAYEEKIVASPEDAEAYRTATKLTQVVAPVLKIGENVFQGFNEQAWQRQLESTGHIAKAAAPTPETARAPQAAPQPIVLTPKPAEASPGTAPSTAPNGKTQ